MRILYLFRSLAVWGGIERILVDKMNGLSSLYGMEIFMLTTDQGTHTIPYNLSNQVVFEDLGICFYRKYRYSLLRRLYVDYKMRCRYKQMLADRLNRISPDIIVCTTSDNIDIVVKLKGSIPLVVESHSICSRTIEKGNWWILRKIYRQRYLRIVSKADVVVALTVKDAQDWQKYLSSVKVIPNMVHLEEGKPSTLDSKHAIFVGRFDYQKRVQDALSIWKEVSKIHPDWVLDIFGEGDIDYNISKMAFDMGNVIIHKPTHDIFNCYRNSSFMIITSLFEPFGLVIVEAASCGLPVVAFDCPYGPAEILTQGVDGYLIKDRNQKMFVEKVCSLIDDPLSRGQMGRAAIETSYKYLPSNILPMWKQLFDELLSVGDSDA